MAKQEYFIGIDLGGTNIQCGVLNGKNKIVARDDTKTKAEQGHEAVIGRVAKLVTKVVDQASLKMQEVACIGIGAPGTIDKKGVVLTAVNLRWNDVALAKKLSDELAIPVVVDNDVNVGAWGEYQAGAGKGHGNQFAIFIGTGIGGGLILDGQLYHGPGLTAGEIGHTVVDADAPLGRRTLENLASRTSMVNQLVQLMNANHPSVLTEITEGDYSKIRSKVLAQAWHQKDALTRQILGAAAKYIGIAIANTVTLLSVQTIVVGGGVVEALGEPWVDEIRQAFRTHVFPVELQDSRILASTLGDDAGIVGAALLARARLQ